MSEKTTDETTEKSSGERPRRTSSTSTTQRDGSSKTGTRSSGTRSSSAKTRTKSSDAGQSESSRGRSQETGSSSGTTGSAKKKMTATAVVKSAVQQFSMLTARQPESVVGVHAQGEGWMVRLEVVESRRVPDSADLLAEYEVELDESGDIVSYDRKDRYVRGRPSA